MSLQEDVRRVHSFRADYPENPLANLWGDIIEHLQKHPDHGLLSSDIPLQGRVGWRADEFVFSVGLEIVNLQDHPELEPFFNSGVSRARLCSALIEIARPAPKALPLHEPPQMTYWDYVNAEDR